MWLSGDRKLMCTKRLTAVPLASRNPINGGIEWKEGRNGRERRKREQEWMNWKERDGFRDC